MELKVLQAAPVTEDIATISVFTSPLRRT